MSDARGICHGNRDSIRLDLRGFHMFTWGFIRLGPQGGQYTYRMRPLVKDGGPLPDGLWQLREAGKLDLPEDEPRVCARCGFVFEGMFLVMSRNQTTREMFA